MVSKCVLGAGDVLVIASNTDGSFQQLGNRAHIVHKLEIGCGAGLVYTMHQIHDKLTVPAYHECRGIPYQLRELSNILHKLKAGGTLRLIVSIPLLAH